MQKQKKSKSIIILIIMGLILILSIAMSKESILTPTSDFIQIAMDNSIDEMNYRETPIGKSFYDFNYDSKPNQIGGKTTLKTNYMGINNDTQDEEDIKAFIDDSNIIVKESSSLFTGGNVLTIISLIISGLMFYFVFKFLKDSKNISVDNHSIVENSNITMDDIIGHDEVKEEILEYFENNQMKATLNLLNVKNKKGLLLEGPPGVGKTLFAKAIASETNSLFLEASAASFMNMYVGTGPKAVRELFKTARRANQAIIFIDEFDSIGSREGGSGGGASTEKENTINELLKQMDGINESDNIFIIAATNYAEKIDKAIKRSGRLDMTISMSLPDKKDRKKLIEFYFKNSFVNLDDETINHIANNTTGFSGADIANLKDDALRRFIKADKDNQIKEAQKIDKDAGIKHPIMLKAPFITKMNEHDKENDVDVQYAKIEIDINENPEIKDIINESIDRILMGPSKSSHKYTDADKEIVAYHEIGHAFIGYMLNVQNQINKVTIIPRANAGGYTSFQENDDTSVFMSSKSLKNEIATLLAGNIAEQEFLSVHTTGASNDFEKVQLIVDNMIKKYNMNNSYMFDAKAPKHIEQIEVDKIAIIKEAELKVKEIFENEDNRRAIKQLAEKLIEKETIYYDDIKNIIEKN